MNNADAFLSAFNEIESLFRRRLQRNKHETFTAMLVGLSNQDALVRRFKDDLYEFAELRNAIVHSKNNDEVIAYPAQKAVDQISRIRDMLLKPPLVKSLFAKQVHCCNEGESLAAVLKLMKRYSISQVPVKNGQGEVTEVINGNTIVRWLSSEDIISITETKICDVISLDSIERKKNFKILSERTDVFTAADVYTTSLHKGWFLDCLLLTANGKASEQLTGIIVLEDIAKYMQ